MTERPHEEMGDQEFLEHFCKIGVRGIIGERQQRARKLAERFPDLRGLDFATMLSRLAELGFAFDFVTSSELHKALNSPR